ncbi:MULTISPECIES: hypothetical protein [unclassified Streptomyces]|uniref:hypothetical protein n=1 Tax=unclassified Streptomyces TaxID=2593676 RepID=UPI001F0391BF|nr:MULTISPECIES: hypothetical protein [unclassified Streptomyces]MCH0567569.1 hypothetical protein [Streptomyces sp. MUM 2J]MCH0572136.1 hypothetical protein [Streptomyces sp. MUM 136J]
MGFKPGYVMVAMTGVIRARFVLVAKPGCDGPEPTGRLREARDRGRTHAFVDARPTSEPVLRGRGFELVTWTRPFVYAPGARNGSGHRKGTDVTAGAVLVGSGQNGVRLHFRFPLPFREVEESIRQRVS